MEPAVWALIGLLAATIVGNTFYLGSRIDAQAARIDTLFSLMLGMKDEIEGLRVEVGTVREEVREIRGLLEGHLERHAG